MMAELSEYGEFAAYSYTLPREKGLADKFLLNSRHLLDWEVLKTGSYERLSVIFEQWAGDRSHLWRAGIVLSTSGAWLVQSVTLVHSVPGVRDVVAGRWFLPSHEEVDFSCPAWVREVRTAALAALVEGALLQQG